jgi:hypothetical protein
VDSPTVSLMTVLILLNMTAKTACVRRVYDVVGAYLHADISNNQLMRIQKSIASIMVEKDPSLEK